MNYPALILILILAVAIVAAYFYMKRRQQQINASDTPQDALAEPSYTREPPADVAPPREDQLP